MIFLRFSMAVLLAGITLATAESGPTLQIKWLGDASPAAGQNGAVVVEINGVPDLDAYSFEIIYDTSALTAIDGALDAPLLNIRNPLRVDKQALLPMIKKGQGMVTIAATLTGALMESGTIMSGVVGMVTFKVKSDPAGKIRLRNLRLLDSKGNPIETVALLRSQL
jgi:hypothetical protein